MKKENGRTIAAVLHPIRYNADSLATRAVTLGGRAIGLPYFQAPAFILEDRTEAAIWGRKAFESALRMHARQARRKRRSS